ncbi:hypothetical protein [Methyloprofundus sedimenti]|nr:hypothetical protein [Methyloprofundus sedimenti]
MKKTSHFAYFSADLSLCIFSFLGWAKSIAIVIKLALEFPYFDYMGEIERYQ